MCFFILLVHMGSAVAQWLSVGLRSQRLGVRNLPLPCYVLEQDPLLPKVLVIPRKRWLSPDMTEKLLTGTLSLNTNLSIESLLLGLQVLPIL